MLNSETWAGKRKKKSSVYKKYNLPFNNNLTHGRHTKPTARSQNSFTYFHLFVDLEYFKQSIISSTKTERVIAPNKGLASAARGQHVKRALVFLPERSESGKLQMPNKICKFFTFLRRTQRRSALFFQLRSIVTVQFEENAFNPHKI
jgi:hypothetical protein